MYHTQYQTSHPLVLSTLPSSLGLLSQHPCYFHSTTKSFTRHKSLTIFWLLTTILCTTNTSLLINSIQLNFTNSNNQTNINIHNRQYTTFQNQKQNQYTKPTTTDKPLYVLALSLFASSFRLCPCLHMFSHFSLPHTHKCCFMPSKNYLICCCRCNVVAITLLPSP